MGYKESNKSNFYADNKSNTRYVYTLVIHEGAKPERYFTELGLYRCLFTSNKPVAIDF